MDRLVRAARMARTVAWWALLAAVTVIWWVKLILHAMDLLAGRV